MLQSSYTTTQDGKPFKLQEKKSFKLEEEAIQTRGEHKSFKLTTQEDKSKTQPNDISLQINRTIQQIKYVTLNF